MPHHAASLVMPDFWTGMKRLSVPQQLAEQVNPMRTPSGWQAQRSRRRAPMVASEKPGNRAASSGSETPGGCAPPRPRSARAWRRRSSRHTCATSRPSSVSLRPRPRQGTSHLPPLTQQGVPCATSRRSSPCPCACGAQPVTPQNLSSGPCTAGPFICGVPHGSLLIGRAWGGSTICCSERMQCCPDVHLTSRPARRGMQYNQNMAQVCSVSVHDWRRCIRHKSMSRQRTWPPWSWARARACAAPAARPRARR